MREDAKRDFSRIGAALFTMFLVSQGVQILLALALKKLWPSYAQDVPILKWVVLFAPIYLVALPVFVGIVRKVPAYRQIAEEPLPAERWGFFRWLRLLPVAFFLMYAGSLIGVVFTLVIAKIVPGAKGLDPTDLNPVLELVYGMPLALRVLVVCMIGPLVEEFVFRKQLIDRTRIYGEELAVLFSAVAFGLFHGNLQQGCYAALLGLLLGYVYLRTQNLIYSFGIHMTVNFMGGVVVPSFALKDALEDPEALAAGQMDPSVYLNTMLLGLFVILMFVAGGILFVVLWKKVHFEPAPRQLAPQEQSVCWQNPGVILFALLCIAAIVLVLFGILK